MRKLSPLGVLIAVVGIGIISCNTGCKTTAQQAVYQTAGTTEVSVETALAAYDQFAKAGKTTVAQNQQVASLYAKYQTAYAVVCDAGSVYAASSITNTAASNAVLNQAVVNASQTITDLENLITSFGVKL